MPSRARGPRYRREDPDNDEGLIAVKALVSVQNHCQLQLGLVWWIREESSQVSDIVTYVKLKLVCDFLNEMQIKKYMNEQYKNLCHRLKSMFPNYS